MFPLGFLCFLLYLLHLRCVYFAYACISSKSVSIFHLSLINIEVGVRLSVCILCAYRQQIARSTSETMWQRGYKSHLIGD